jgi:hypothetical protein
MSCDDYLINLVGDVFASRPESLVCEMKVIAKTVFLDESYWMII